MPKEFHQEFRHLEFMQTFFLTVFFFVRHDRLSERGNAQGSTGPLILVAFENKKNTPLLTVSTSRTGLPYNNN